MHYFMTITQQWFCMLQYAWLLLVTAGTELCPIFVADRFFFFFLGGGLYKRKTNFFEVYIKHCCRAKQNFCEKVLAIQFILLQ
jgi:hypothetical protein